jgi:hypothetical protein
LASKEHFGLDFLPARLTPVGRGYFLCQDKKYEEELSSRRRSNIFPLSSKVNFITMIRLSALAITLLTFYSNLHSQVLQRESLIGVWICLDASTMDNVPKEELEAIPMLKSVFISSKFIFKSNGLFELQLPKDSPSKFKQLYFLNNRKWSIDQKESLVYIGQPSENLMQITVIQKEGAIHFFLSETPLLLLMQKQEQ